MPRDSFRSRYYRVPIILVCDKFMSSKARNLIWVDFQLVSRIKRKRTNDWRAVLAFPRPYEVAVLCERLVLWCFIS